jgi:hypothetical protein
MMKEGICGDWLQGGDEAIETLLKQTQLTLDDLFLFFYRLSTFQKLKRVSIAECSRLHPSQRGWTK